MYSTQNMLCKLTRHLLLYIGDGNPKTLLSTEL